MRKSTKVAFEEMIHTRGIYKTLGMNESTVRSYRRRFDEGKLSLEKMEALLQKAGWKVVQEKLWEGEN